MTTTTDQPAAAPETPPDADERLSSSHALSRILRRPEVGALAGAIVIFVFFAVTTVPFSKPSGATTWIFTASNFGIMAVAVAMLMIGGEFDLSAGTMIGTTGLTTGILMTEYNWNVWAAVAASSWCELGYRVSLSRWARFSSFVASIWRRPRH
jgi:simple sugar transport system permease protein